MEKKATSFDGVRINYSISRNKPYFLVFLHGLGGDLTLWKRERAFFHKKGFSTLAIDLRGHGLSERPASPDSYELEYFAKDIKGVLNNEKVEDFIIIAHCFGGIVATCFQKLYPNTPRGYVLIDTSAKGHPAMRILARNPYLVHIINSILPNTDLRRSHFKHVDFSRFKGTGDWNMRRIASDIVHTSLRSWFFTFEHISAFDGISILDTIKIPVLIIEGEHDTIFSLRTAVKLHKSIRMSCLTVLPKANHQVPLNNINTLESAIMAYINEMRTQLLIHESIEQ